MLTSGLTCRLLRCRFPVSGGAFAYVLVRRTGQQCGPAAPHLWLARPCSAPVACRTALSLSHPLLSCSTTAPQVTFGEFPGFVTLASLLLEYALGMAATARGFSLYLNSLLDLSPETLIININNGAHTLDPMVGWVGRGGAGGAPGCLPAAPAGPCAGVGWLT